MSTLAVTKGHGTENDFVLVADPEGTHDLSADLVRALTDRRSGIGADGVIRVAPTASMPGGQSLLDAEPAARWFMDYRNADGSIAQMCGNGVRVFAAFLEHLGLEDLSSGRPIPIGTRAGIRHVRREAPGYYAVGMGQWRLPGGADAAASGADSAVRTAGIVDQRPGLRVDMGNPHTVVALADEAELAAADLLATPIVTPTPAEGTNVEYVVALDATSEVGRARMRVHERGVGETRSCGTGACAAAVAVRTWAGARAPSTWYVDVPGGTVRVVLGADGDVELAGPAALVAHAVVDLDALSPGPDA